MTFPFDRINEIQARPEDFQLIERVPWTASSMTFPLHVHEPVGDEVGVIFLDVETTGLDVIADQIIELGLVKALVSPSTGQVTTVVAMTSLYRDPGFPIPELVTDITGITDSMVAGQSIREADIADWFEGDPIVVAHNASFDRGFFERLFPQFGQLRWACSIKDIPWSELGFEGSKLEYLLLKRRFFYEGHRASIDCLALAFLMETVKKASRWLFANESEAQCTVEAYGSPFAEKDTLKGRGYRWDGDKKVWHTTLKKDDLDAELSFLNSLYYQGGSHARVTELTSRQRYKRG